MIEELKIIAEIFKNATDGALYAYLAFIVYQLIKTSIWIFPIVGLVKYIVNRLVVDENKKN